MKLVDLEYYSKKHSDNLSTYHRAVCVWSATVHGVFGVLQPYRTSVNPGIQLRSDQKPFSRWTKRGHYEKLQSLLVYLGVYFRYF